jgi:hypothetical protein
MYIDPFVAGIMFTILVELGLTIALVIALPKKIENDKEKK